MLKLISLNPERNKKSIIFNLADTPLGWDPGQYIKSVLFYYNLIPELITSYRNDLNKFNYEG